LARKYRNPEELLNRLREFSRSDRDKLDIDGITIATKEDGKMKIRLPLRIYLPYHNIRDYGD